MSNKLFALNIICTVFESLVCLSVIAVFTFTAYHFGKWWVCLFNVVPLFAYNGWRFMVEEDDTSE